jgi:tetraacyldisaccharide 4'-kinase
MQPPATSSARPAPPASGSAGAPPTWRSRLSTRLQRSWVKRDWLAYALLDVSYLYRALVAVRRWLYARGIFKSYCASVPVIVVGNVVAGGAGKTPVVIEVVRHLLAQGYKPGVVSRGYGRTVRREDVNDSGFLEVADTTPVVDAGDEPALIQRETGAPVFVATQRITAARALLAAHPQVNVIVCDDGLQHLALQRDIEVCVFDDRGVGNGWLLPAGPLREPWPGAAGRRVDFVLHTAASFAPPEPPPEPPPDQKSPIVAQPDSPPAFTIQRHLATYALRADGSQVALQDIAQQPVHAVAAIAQPEAFFTMLRAQGLTVAGTSSLPDHYNFSSCSCYIPLGQTLICTQKDAMKLWPTHPQALAVPLVVDIPAAFFTALLEKLSSPHGHQTT